MQRQQNSFESLCEGCFPKETEGAQDPGKPSGYFIIYYLYSERFCFTFICFTNQKEKVDLCAKKIDWGFSVFWMDVLNYFQGPIKPFSWISKGYSSFTLIFPKSCSFFPQLFQVPYSALTMFLSTDQKDRDSATAYRECDLSSLRGIGAEFYWKSFLICRKFRVICVPKLDFYKNVSICDEN